MDVRRDRRWVVAVDTGTSGAQGLDRPVPVGSRVAAEMGYEAIARGDLRRRAASPTCPPGAGAQHASGGPTWRDEGAPVTTRSSGGRESAQQHAPAPADQGDSERHEQRGGEDDQERQQAVTEDDIEAAERQPGGYRLEVLLAGEDERRQQGEAEPRGAHQPQVRHRTRVLVGGEPRACWLPRGGGGGAGPP